jgi:hypothetical protein
VQGTGQPAGQASSGDDGFSPLLLVLIAVGVLAAISAVAVTMRGKGRRKPGVPASPNAS